MPRAVGVITTPSGAAIREVLSILKRRRFPALPVVVCPVPVQGAGAATEAVHWVLYPLAVLLVIYFVAVRARLGSASWLKQR